MSLAQLLFLVVGGLVLAGAVATVLARNLVHAALSLVGFFLAVAAVYVLLEAEFLALVQVLIYVGAVSVLLLFGIMLTRNIEGLETGVAGRGRILVSAGVAILLGVILIEGIRELKPESMRAVSTATESDSAAGEAGSLDLTQRLGRDLMTRHLVAFEVAGLLLTAAVVGAVALSREEAELETSVEGRAGSGPPPVGDRVGVARSQGSPEGGRS